MVDLLLPFLLLFWLATYRWFRMAYKRGILWAFALAWVCFFVSGLLLEEGPGITGEIPGRWPALRAVWRDEAGPTVVLARPHYRLAALYPKGLAPGSRILALAGKRLDSWQDLKTALATHPREGVLTGSLFRRALQRDFVLPLTWLESEEGISWEEEVMASVGLTPVGLPVWESGRVAKSWGIFAGTVIYSMNGKPADQVADWHRAMTNALENPKQGVELKVRIHRPFKVRTVKAWPGKEGWGITLPPALQLPTRFVSFLPVDAVFSLAASLARVPGFGSMGLDFFRFLPGLPFAWYKIPSYRWMEPSFWLYKLGTAFTYLALSLALLSLLSRFFPRLARGPWPALLSYALVALLLCKDFFRVLHV